MECPYCKTPISDDVDFCTNCGKYIPLPHCKQCGTTLVRGAKFCSECGASQKESPEPASRKKRQNSRKDARQSEQEDVEPTSGEEQYDEPYDEEDWDEEDMPPRRWAPLIVVIIVGAVVVILFAAWRFGILGDLFHNGTEEAVVEEVVEEEIPETEHQLTFVTKTLEFDEPGLTSRIYFDTDIEDQSEIEWSSSDSSVARVDENGYVTSVGSGRAVITAQWGDVSAVCNVACDYTSASTQTAEDADSAENAVQEETPEQAEETENTEDTQTTAAANGDYLCTFSSERLITQADMSAIAASDYGTLPAGKSLAQMIINEIYAKHGYQFQTAEIQQYFDQKSWYQALGSYSPDADVAIGKMNEIEKQNIEFLNNY